MSTFAKSAAPSHAVLMWADERNVYAQLPSVNGPYVAIFARTEGGLGAALHQLGAMKCEHAGEPYIRPNVPSKELISKGLTQNDREAAWLALKKIGAI
jgi:hypothetical protein